MPIPVTNVTPKQVIVNNKQFDFEVARGVWNWTCCGGYGDDDWAGSVEEG